MKLLKIKLEDFKGFSGEKSGSEISIFKRTMIEGKNGSGKSTIYDAHLWLFSDKDSRLKSNPDIRPDDGHECIVRVQEDWEINGAIISIAKFQKMKKTEYDDGRNAKIALSNHYEINGRSLGEREFKKDLSGRGFDFENFLPLSHVDVFTDDKSANMRKTLFGMTTEKTDQQIAEMTEGCEEVAELLKNYTVEEIFATNKNVKKRAEEQIEAIPNQIIGMERSKVNIDVSEWARKRDEIKREISDLEHKISDSMENMKTADALFDEIQVLKKQKREIESGGNSKNEAKRNGINIQIKEKESTWTDKKRNLRSAEYDLEKCESRIKVYSEKLKKAREDYTHYSGQEFDETRIREIESEIFDESSLICPTCGQTFPSNKQDETRMLFETSKKKRIAEEEEKRRRFKEELELQMKSITESGNRANQELKEEEKKRDAVKKQIEQLEKELSDLESVIRVLNTELNAIPESVDLSGNAEYIEIQKKISVKELELSSMENGSEYRKSKELELKEKQQALLGVEAEIAKSENDVRIEKQIEELKQKQREHSQKKASAERIIYQLSLVSKAKNTLLEDEINSCFSGVRFKLFDFQKNGEYKEICLPEILNADGEWKTLGKTANTALEIKGKLAIISGLQKFHRISYPVFLDFAAELDEKTMEEIRPEFQIVFLKVSGGELKVREVE